MSRLHDLWKALEPGTKPEPKPQEPITRIVSGGTEKNPFARQALTDPSGMGDPMRVQADRIKAVRQWRQVYQRGGPVAECIDVYALMALTNGWKLQYDEGIPGAEQMKDTVQEWLDQPHVDLDSIMWQGIIDACVCGTAFQEIIKTQGGGIWGVVPRDASSFWTRVDEYGKLLGYSQITMDNITLKETRIDAAATDQILTLTIFPVAGEVYGTSLIHRAWDDILRDLDTIESISKAIHRHGTPKQQWDMGTPEFPASPQDMTALGKTLKNMKADTDFVTTATTCNMLDTSGVQNVAEYSNVSLQRMATAMGVPEEIVGLGRGSTEATATVRMRAFYDKVSTIQEIVARTYSRKVIDKITGVPGAVWIEFNDPNPADETATAQWIAALRTGMDPEAVVPASWARERLGIPPDEDVDRTVEVKARPPAIVGKDEEQNTDEVQGE